MKDFLFCLGMIIISAIIIICGGCKTYPETVPTTQYINTASTQAGSIVTQTNTVEKIIYRVVTDERGKKEALTAVAALKATEKELVITLSTLKNVNAIVAQNYANMRESAYRWRSQRNLAIISFLIFICAFCVLKIIRII